MRAGFQRDSWIQSVHHTDSPTVPSNTLGADRSLCLTRPMNAPWIRFTLPKPRDFWQPRRSPRAATLWGLSGTQGSLAAQRRRTQPLPEFREKTEHPQLFLAAPRSSIRAAGEETSLHSPHRGPVPAPGGLAYRGVFVLFLLNHWWWHKGLLEGMAQRPFREAPWCNPVEKGRKL